MNEITLRAPTDDDWPAILALAELSLAELPNAPSQNEWLNNRKSFSPSDGIQQHFVATSDEQIVGYACIEHRNKASHESLRPRVSEMIEICHFEHICTIYLCISASL